MNEPQSPLARIFFLDALQRLFVERLTRRAFVVAEDVDPDGGGHRTERSGGCRLSEGEVGSGQRQSRDEQSGG